MIMRFILIIPIVLLCSSCAVINGGQEFTKTIWGSSTRVLEQARDTAITKTYDKPYWDCVRQSIDILKDQKLVIFKKDEVRGYVVVMGIKGSVDTTEVGVFFDEMSDEQTRLQISSLSTNAKRKLAALLFHQLDIAFGLAPPDPVVEEPVNDRK